MEHYGFRHTELHHRALVGVTEQHGKIGANPLPHFRRRLGRKCDGNNAIKRDAMFNNQPDDAQ
jgi:hypothetical protein